MYDDNHEVLKGKVKQITEIAKKSYSGVDTVIVDFDVHGNITQIITEGGSGDGLVKCEYTHDKNGKKTSVIQKYYEKWESYKNCRKQQTYKYDGNGHIAESIANTKMLKENSDHEVKQDIAFFKYDNEGYLIAYDGYLDTEHRFSAKYKYNTRHLLIERDHFSEGGHAEGKRIYKYQVIDKKENWLKRTISSSYDSTKADTFMRKITYY